MDDTRPMDAEQSEHEARVARHEAEGAGDPATNDARVDPARRIRDEDDLAPDQRPDLVEDDAS